MVPIFASPLEVSFQTLRWLLEARGVPGGLSPVDLVRHARDPRHKLAVTLTSVLARDGHQLPDGLLDEVANHRRRIQRYADLWSRIHALAPTAHVVKGSEIAQSYPDGVLRSAGDLDVVCPDQRMLWVAARWLIAQGWELHALTVVADHAGGAHHVLMDVRSDADSEIFGVPYVVELRTVDIATSLRHRARRLSGSAAEPLPRNIASLLAERWERRFTSRDLLDLALLTQRLTSPARQSLTESLEQSSLWPEWREAARALDALGWLPRMELMDTTSAPGRDAVARLRRALAGWGHPLRAASYLAQSTVDADRGKLADWLAAQLHRRIGCERLLHAGVPLFGVPLDDGGHDIAEMALTSRGGHIVAQTPVGDFLLVTGACRQEWLAQARGPSRASA